MSKDETGARSGAHGRVEKAMYVTYGKIDNRWSGTIKINSDMNGEQIR